MQGNNPTSDIKVLCTNSTRHNVTFVFGGFCEIGIRFIIAADVVGMWF